MAAARRVLLSSLSLLLIVQVAWSQFTICNNTGLKRDSFYQRRTNSSYCYVIFLTRMDFSSANRTCVRSNGHLAKIDSESEDQYIKQTFISSAPDFWIGLTDQVAEGVFRWVEGDTLLVPNNSYTNWFGGSAAVTNQGPFDCVKFTSEGWKVHDYFCDSSTFPFLCRQEVCSSSDGVSCATSAPEVSSPLSATIIAVIIVIAVMLIVVILVIILLVLMWKYRNDAFYRYILCCVYGGSKTQINNLKQENIRLRKELSQQKLNLSSSDRFQPGQLSRQTSVLSSPGSVAPLGVEKSRAPPIRSFSSNQIRPLLTPQVSGAKVMPPKRSLSTASGLSLPPVNPNMMRPILPFVKDKTSPISEEVFPKQNRPSSSSSSSSSSSNNSTTVPTDDKTKETEIDTSKTATDGQTETNTKT